MSIKDMPFVTVEQVNALRAEAIRIDRLCRELLALVQAIVHGRGHCFIPTDDPSRHTFNWDERARDAIAKATGEQP
jgi:hypothetical protein